MNMQTRPHLMTANDHLPFERVVLALQGGGALGAYQAGAYEALAERGVHPNWITGISIGAINAAIIAGNPPDRRIDRLREFWTLVTANAPWHWPEHAPAPFDATRNLLSQASANLALMQGAQGFFAARALPPWFHKPGTIEATSMYHTGDLKRTLERLVDFERINAGPLRFSVGAVNIRTGNFVCFDSETHIIEAAHVMASGALPPGFPPVEIEGEHYWDGGLVSNTPLQWVLDHESRQDTLAFEIDLWSTPGELPRTISDVVARDKEIRYASRSRAGMDQFKRLQKLRRAAADLLHKLPAELRDTGDAKLLGTVADKATFNIVQLSYRPKCHEGHVRDYEFSRMSMEEHWRSGYHDAQRALRHPQVLARPDNPEGMLNFDLLRHGRE